MQAGIAKISHEKTGEYTSSYSIEDKEAAKAFYYQYGFVVFHDIFTAEECHHSRNAMWRIIESSNPGFLRDDPSTWNCFKSAGKYGLSSRGPSFDPVLLCNRQNNKLAEALSTIVEIPMSDLMTSHDRFTIYRATESAESNAVDGRAFETGRRNAHIDLNPWWWLEASEDIITGAESLTYDDTQDFIRENNFVVRSMGRHVQCILNFEDNHEEDGGTIIVPGFHQCLEDWSRKYKHLRKNIPWFQFPPGDRRKDGEPGAAEAELLARAQRVPMRAGSVLIWDQTVAHGSSPNRSSRCRLAQFLKAFPRSLSFSRDSDASAQRLHTGCIGSSKGQEGVYSGSLDQAGLAPVASVEGKDDGSSSSSLASNFDSLTMGTAVTVKTGTCRDKFVPSSPDDATDPSALVATETNKPPTAAYNFEAGNVTGTEHEYAGPSASASASAPSLVSEAVPAAPVYSTARLVRRAVALRTQLELAGSLAQVTPLGRQLFGLDVLDNLPDL